MGVFLTTAGKLEGASLSVYYKSCKAESEAKILGKVLVDTKVCLCLQ